MPTPIRSIAPKFSRMMAFLLVTAGIAACATPPAPQYPELRFTHLPAITLGVANIKVVDARPTTSAPNHVEARMPRPPAEALRNWAQDRLRATGTSGTAVFTIEEAEVVETDLKTMSGVKGAFTNEQAERYDGKVKASLRIEGLPNAEAYASATVNHSQTLAENATINDREDLWFEMSEKLLQAFDPAMSNSIRQHLGEYLR